MSAKKIETSQQTDKILDVKGLKTYFFTENGVVRAVDDVSFHIYRGETLGLVGESGSGKTQTALSIMRLVPAPPGEIVAGEVLRNGEDMLQYSEEKMREIRGNEISMIFQDPMTSLNPVYTIGDQISEAIELHQRVSPREALQKAAQMLDIVGVPAAASRLGDYPHLFSGGMRQRVMIAMALSCNPDILIADEPTTALDVTVQAQVIELLRALKKQFKMSILLITHDLGVIAELADRVCVMYAGQMVEISDVRTVFKFPKHPYTAALLSSIPRVDEKKETLEVIPGGIPNLIYIPPGCRFHPRCKFAWKACREEYPDMVEIKPGHQVRCLIYSGQVKVPDTIKEVTL
ncbi:MAG: ABC transporter ATP-binding protein [Candidatus Kariarchaeaceae archaeon]